MKLTFTIETEDFLKPPLEREASYDKILQLAVDLRANEITEVIKNKVTQIYNNHLESMKVPAKPLTRGEPLGYNKHQPARA